MNWMWTCIIVFMLLAAVDPVYGQTERVIASPFTPENVSFLRNETAEVMALTEDQTIAAVPEQSGICFTDCPNCDMSTADMGHFAWNPSQPHAIVCKDCSAAYPENPKYPDDQVLEVRSIHGTHRYPYYTRPDGYRIYFRAHADFLGRAYMAKACANLAELYWLTKEEQYARRAAIILVRFAQVYPGYALHYDYPDDQKKIAPFDHGTLTPQEPPRTAKWSQWAYMDISQELTRAYDILRTWKPFHELADGKAAQLVERDLLGGMLDYTMAIEESYSNMSPMKWRDAIDAARVIGRRPEVIHDAVARLEKFLASQFLYDGTWMETSPSYMRQTAGWLEYVNNSLAGYEDPAGYTHPQTGRRIDAESIRDLRAVGQRAMEVISETLLPDGRLLPVNDTWSEDKWPARQSMAPVLEPGFGVAILGGGEGEKQYHAWLNFTSGKFHKQQDALSIGLWAHGKELLSDIGYTHTKYRYWATSTASHNTVLVDGADQQYDVDHKFNRLRSWSTDGRGFHAVEAESDGVYSQTRRYRRTLIAVGNDSSNAYLVDVFQVHGGSQHDYLLAGSADEDSTAELAGMPPTPLDGTLLNSDVDFVVPANETRQVDPRSGLGYIRDLRTASAPNAGPVVLDCRLAQSPHLGTRTRLWTGGDSTIYLGQAPSIRRSQGNDSALEKFTMPMLIARRRGDDLQSTFIAVHEPVNGAPSITDVRLQHMSGDIIVLEISRNDMTDFVLVAMDGPAEARVPTPIGDLHFQGAQGFVRIQDGKVAEAHLVNGSHMELNDVKLSGVAAQTGRIVEAHRDETPQSRGWFVVKENLELREATDALLLVRYPDGTTQGYQVAGIESEPGGQRLLVRQRPAFEHVNGVIELTSFPQRSFPQTEQVSYELLHSHHHCHE